MPLACADRRIEALVGNPLLVLDIQPTHPYLDSVHLPTLLAAGVGPGRRFVFGDSHALFALRLVVGDGDPFG